MPTSARHSWHQPDRPVAALAQDRCGSHVARRPLPVSGELHGDDLSFQVRLTSDGPVPGITLFALRSLCNPDHCAVLTTRRLREDVAERAMNDRRVGAIGRKSQVWPSAVFPQRNRFLLKWARSARRSRKRPLACWEDSASPRPPRFVTDALADMARLACLHRGEVCRQPIVTKRGYKGLVARAGQSKRIAGGDGCYASTRRSSFQSV